MVKREIISLHLGQAGIQCANSIWELYCIEHSVDPDGYNINIDEYDDDTSYETFFEKIENSRYVPRVVFFDTEDIVIDTISTGPYRQLYHPLQLIKGYEDAANNFARGCFSVSKEHLNSLLERIRRLNEACSNLEGIFITHSLGGGTGSGFGSVLSHALEAEYSNNCVVQTPILPSQVMTTSVVEPYNSVLHLHSTIQTMDLSFMFSNDALYNISNDLLHQPSPTYTDINRILAMVLSSATASIRFKSQLNSDLIELQTNLVPYPRIHYPLLRYAPIFDPESSKQATLTIDSLTRDIFKTRYQTLNICSNVGRYMAVVLNYRGELSQHDVNLTIQKLKKNSTISFVDWCPTGFKISLSDTIQSVPPESHIEMSRMAVSMIANTTSVKEVWVRLFRKYMALLEKKSFVHWYTFEGMEISEFYDALNTFMNLIQDYDECCLSSGEMEYLYGGRDDKIEEKEKPKTPVPIERKSNTPCMKLAIFENKQKDQNKSKKDENKKDKIKKDKSEKDESNSDKSEKDESNSDKSEKDESKKDKSEKDESKKDKSKKDKSKKDKSKKDKSKKDKSKKDESKKDKSKEDKSKKDESKKDKSKEDKSKKNKCICIP